jgi:hypothetical protein
MRVEEEGEGEKQEGERGKNIQASHKLYRDL